MLVINGKKFAVNDKEFTDSLFHRGGTCVGFYKVMKNEIKLYNLQNVQIGVITKKEKVLGKCTILENGKKWYSYGTIKEIGEHESYVKYREEIENIVNKLYM